MTNDKEKEAEEAARKATEEAEAKAAAQGTDDPKDRDPPKTEDKTKKVPDTKSPLEEARALDKSIKDGIVEIKKLFEKNEKALADAQIAGKGFAGQPTTQQLTEDEKWVIEAKKRYEGTGMDPTEPIKEVTYS